MIDILSRRKREKIEETPTQVSEKKWVTFTYMGKETRYITKLFKKFNLNIVWQTINTLEQHLTKTKHKGDIYDRCSVYKMKCMECGGAYIGQTGRKFHIRYKEHIRDIRSNRDNTGYSNHILNTGHTYDTLEDKMQVVNIQNKGPHLNTLERFQIYKEQKTGVILNDNYADLYNPLFELVTTVQGSQGWGVQSRRKVTCQTTTS
jgi:hypothetical protein